MIRNLILRLRCLWHVIRLHTDGLTEAHEALIEMCDFWRMDREYRGHPVFRENHEFQLAKAGRTYTRPTFPIENENDEMPSEPAP